MNQKFYLTTAIPYVNGKPHVGHALEYLIADAIHRYHELIGDNTRISSGADENALKNVRAAEKAGVPVQEFLDQNSAIFREFYEKLGVDLDEFRRGTDQKLHWPGVQKLWELADKNGDIYKKSYTGLYCVGCESFKQPKDLVEGKCPEHQVEPEEVTEENYFFKLSKYQEKLLQLIESGEYAIYPEKRKREIVSFIKQGLEDFSISRSVERASEIGVPVPGDEAQKMYVWFDALTIYMTAVGWGYDEEQWIKWWPADLHVIGKDIIRFHAVYWPAMLMAANLPLPRSLVVHGFIGSGGVKMSKSLGNVIDPYLYLNQYGLDPLRYFLLSQIPTLDDGDFTDERFREVYNADLANGLGNLVARVAKLAENAGFEFKTEELQFDTEIKDHFEKYEINLAVQKIWERVAHLDQFLSDEKPWKQEGTALTKTLDKSVTEIRAIAYNLKPIIPETSEKILKQFAGPKITSGEPLFPRLK